MPEKKANKMRNITISVPHLIVANIRTLKDFDFESSFSEFARRAIKKQLIRDLKLLDDLEYKKFEESVKEARGNGYGKSMYD